MIFKSPGYPFEIHSAASCRDASAHQFTLIYKFLSLATRYAYVIDADYHDENVFALKFYAQKGSKDDHNIRALPIKAMF